MKHKKIYISFLSPGQLAVLTPALLLRNPELSSIWGLLYVIQVVTSHHLRYEHYDL